MPPIAPPIYLRPSTWFSCHLWTVYLFSSVPFPNMGLWVCILVAKVYYLIVLSIVKLTLICFFRYQQLLKSFSIFFMPLTFFCRHYTFQFHPSCRALPDFILFLVSTQFSYCVCIYALLFFYEINNISWFIYPPIYCWTFGLLPYLRAAVNIVVYLSFELMFICLGVNI